MTQIVYIHENEHEAESRYYKVKFSLFIIWKNGVDFVICVI